MHSQPKGSPSKFYSIPLQYSIVKNLCQFFYGNSSNETSESLDNSSRFDYPNNKVYKAKLTLKRNR